MGKVEICIREYLRELEREACGDRDFIEDLKAEFIDWFEKTYRSHIAAWRNRGENLIAYVETKEKAEEILGKRGQIMWGGGYLRFRPALDKGEIDHRYYKIRVSLDYRLPVDLAIVELEKCWALWEVVICDSKTGDDGTLIVYA